MSAPNEFKWVNSSKPRAKAIPPKVWEAHRAEIIDLYVRTSLENMMAVMRQRGFHANERQYTHRLGCWGVVKYNTAGSRARSMGNQAQSGAQTIYQFHAMATAGPSGSQNAAAAAAELAKRQRSEQSVATAVGSKGSRSPPKKPSKPPSKKARLDAWVASKRSSMEQLGPMNEPAPGAVAWTPSSWMAAGGAPMSTSSSSAVASGALMPTLPSSAVASGSLMPTSSSSAVTSGVLMPASSSSAHGGVSSRPFCGATWGQDGRAISRQSAAPSDDVSMLDLDRASASGRGSFAPLLGRRDAVGSVDVHASFFGASDDEDEGAGGAGTPRRYDRLGKQVATAPSVHTSHDAMPTSSDAWAAPRAFSPEDMHAIYARLRRCHGYSPSSGQEDYDDSDDDGYEVDDEDEDNDSTPDASVMITDGQGQRRNSRWYDAESVISTGSVVPTTPSVVGTLSSLGHWGSSEDVSRLGTQLDFDRDVETYSTEEMAKIRHAAEYLHCLDLEEEAFKLRVLVLKRYQAIPPSRSSRASRRAVFGAILACARCASITRHCVIVQTLLNKELENASARARANALVDKRSAAVFGSSFSFALGGTGPAKVSRLEPFLIHMFLAETSFRDFQDAATARQLDLALEQVVGAGGWPEMLAELPDDDRSLDLLLYHQLVRALSPHCDLLEPTALSELRPASDSVRELEDALLTRHPGPFEMDEGSGGVGNPFRAMRNPCLRSCLAWICRELETLSSLTRTWAKMQQVGIANTGSAWLETTVLFTCLWDRWHATAPDTFAVQEKASRASSGANDAGDATPRSRLSAASSVGYYAAAGVDPSATTPLLGDFDLACQDRDSSASVRVGLGMGSGSGTGLEAADDTYTAWMTQSESRMGLSSAELLRTMCGLVSIASHWTFSEREQSLRRRLLTGVLNLANLDDDELARRFLRAFVFRNLVGHISGGGEYYNGPPGGGEGSRDCSEGGAAADVRLHEERMASRVHILGMLEKVLRVALPPEVHAAAAAGSGFAAGAAEAASYAAGQAASYAAGAAGAFMGMVGTLASSAASVAAAAASDPFQGQAGGPLRAAASTILLHMPQITGSGGGSADKANGTNNKPGGYGSPTLASSLKSDDSSLQRMRTTTAVASRRGGLGGGVGEGYGHTASQLLAEARGRPRTAGGNSAISNISMGGNSSGSRVAGRVAQGSAGGIAPPSGAVVQRESLSGSGVSRASTSVSTVSEILERTLTIEDRGSPSTAVATAAAAAAATVACNMAVAAAGGMQRAGHVVRSHVARMASSSGSSNSRDSRSLLDDDVQDAVELRSWAPLYDGIQQGKRGNSIR